MTPSDKGYSREPGSLVERAADAAMIAADDVLHEAGAELKQMVVLIYAGDVPEGEPDCTSAGHGFEDARDLLAAIFGHFEGAARKVGIDVKLAPLGRG